MRNPIFIHYKRLVSWSLLMTAIAGFTVYKSVENATSISEQEQWRNKIVALVEASNAEAERLIQRIQALDEMQNAKQELQNDVNGGKPFVLQTQGVYDNATWVHPEYGFAAEFTFFEDKLVSYGTNSGWSRVVSVHPQPPFFSSNSSAEYVRRIVPWLAILAWTAGLLIWIWRIKLRQGAAEVMLVAAFACGAAWSVDPKYASTQASVDYRLGIALLMVGLATAALPSALMKARHAFRVNLRFLLALTAAAAVLSTLLSSGGPIFATGIFAMLFGVAVYLVSSKLSSVAGEKTGMHVIRLAQTWANHPMQPSGEVGRFEVDDQPSPPADR